jgi:hypothetical protein
MSIIIFILINLLYLLFRMLSLLYLKEFWRRFLYFIKSFFCLLVVALYFSQELCYLFSIFTKTPYLVYVTPLDVIVADWYVFLISFYFYFIYIFSYNLFTLFSSSISSVVKIQIGSFLLFTFLLFSLVFYAGTLSLENSSSLSLLFIYEPTLVGSLSFCLWFLSFLYLYFLIIFFLSLKEGFFFSFIYYKIALYFIVSVCFKLSIIVFVLLEIAHFFYSLAKCYYFIF